MLCWRFQALYDIGRHLGILPFKLWDVGTYSECELLKIAGIGNAGGQKGWGMEKGMYPFHIWSELVKSDILVVF